MRRDEETLGIIEMFNIPTTSKEIKNSKHFILSS
jgi:hypothetical protein